VARAICKPVLCSIFAAALLQVCAGQTDCGHAANAIEQVQSSGLTTQQVIERAATNEAAFKSARTHYTYTQEISIQTLRAVGLPGNYVTDGEYRQVAHISYDHSGRRIEQVVFAPMSTLQRVTPTPEDFEDIYTFATYVLVPSEISKYHFNYEGRQHIDDLDAYVFDVAPRTVAPKQRYFQGRIWIDHDDLAIVKTCGKAVPDSIPHPGKKKKKNAQENIHATYVTYREQFNNSYWFPTYTRSDDIFHFGNDEIRTRTLVKYSGYARPEQQRAATPAR